MRTQRGRASATLGGYEHLGLSTVGCGLSYSHGSGYRAAPRKLGAKSKMTNPIAERPQSQLNHLQEQLNQRKLAESRLSQCLIHNGKYSNLKSREK